MLRPTHAKALGVSVLVILTVLTGYSSAQSGIVTTQDIDSATQVVEWQIAQDLFVKGRKRKLSSLKITGCWSKDELSEVKVTTARGRPLKVLRSRVGKNGKQKTYPIQLKTSRLKKIDYPLLVQATFSSAQIVTLESAIVSGVTEGTCHKGSCSSGATTRTKRLKSAGPSCSGSVPLATGGSITAIGQAGGDIEYPGIGTIHITPGTFGSDTAVRFEALSSPKLQALFDEFGGFFRVQNRMAYDLRIALKGSVPLSEVVSVEIVLPQAIRDLIGTGVRLDTFVRGIHGGGLEELETIQLIQSTLDASGEKLLVDLPAYAFVELDATSFEALLTVGATPGSSGALVLAADDGSSCQKPDPNSCQAQSIRCPLASGCDQVSSGFNPSRVHPVTGEQKPHWGTDFAVPQGTGVLAASDGIIEKTYSSQTYGETIIVRHSNGSASLYAHLSERQASVGTPVLGGQQIGLSGNTGTSTGPHLHFEYTPNGEIIQSNGRIDPFPCIGDQTTGSITVSDNGSAADDAFTVYLDGVLLGSTTVGGANTLAISNLLCGSHQLTLVVDFAPDDFGTFQILLFNGLTFAGGGVVQSGVLPEGATQIFEIFS